MEQTTNFKLIISFIFGFFIVVGLVYLVISPAKKGKISGDVMIWGTYDESVMNTILSEINSSLIHAAYRKKSPTSYEDDLIEAFASGNGPDVFLLTDDMAVRFRDKTYPIPATAMSERVFRDTFIEEGELFVNNGVIMALPVFTDPLVLYWNRDLFTSSGVSRVPDTWTEFLSVVPRLTVRSEKGEIVRPCVAVGEFSNVMHAKELLVALFLQTGSDIVKEGVGGLVLDFVSNAEDSVIRFYTDFARPRNDAYTWNRSLRSDIDMFASGDLAMYVGYASEHSLIFAQNPHLNFDMAKLPTLSDDGRVATYGHMHAVAISKGTKNPAVALYAADKMSRAASLFIDAYGVASARRSDLDVASSVDTDSYQPIINASALISRSWLDPDGNMSYTVFKDMIESITGGKIRNSEAIYVMEQELRQYIKDHNLGDGIR